MMHLPVELRVQARRACPPPDWDVALPGLAITTAVPRRLTLASQASGHDLPDIRIQAHSRVRGGDLDMLHLG